MYKEQTGDQLGFWALLEGGGSSDRTEWAWKILKQQKNGKLVDHSNDHLSAKLLGKSSFLSE